jgi:saccharopine dehydrogenase-like NADP-dependent oxidoreductase
MYVRKSRKVVDGKVVYVDPLEDTGTIVFPGEGEYEYFLSDGLRSLLFNFSDVPYMAEYSPRWKGHVEQMRLIRDLGLISKEDVEVRGCVVKPIEVAAEVINRQLTVDPRDKVMTMAIGYMGDRYLRYVNVEYYDEATGLTAMQRTTGFNLSRFTIMALEGDLVRKVGLNYPEEFGLDQGLFEKYKSHMGKVDIEFTREEGTVD